MSNRRKNRLEDGNLDELEIDQPLPEAVSSEPLPRDNIAPGVAEQSTPDSETVALREQIASLEKTIAELKAVSAQTNQLLGSDVAVTSCDKPAQSPVLPPEHRSR